MLPSKVHSFYTAVVDCGAPDGPDNGIVSFVNGSTGFRAEANYSCNLGYDLVGPERAVCQADGTWSERPPNCIRKQHDTAHTYLHPHTTHMHTQNNLY